MSRDLKKVCLIGLWVLIVASTVAESTAQQSRQFDLSKLGMVINGEQTCNDTGNRLQDFPSPTMDQIIAAGPKAIPILIGMIADRHMAQTKEPLICYWPGMAVADIAFCLLSDLFKYPGAKITVPGTSWSDLLSPENSGAAWDQLHGFIRKHGTAALQARWRAVWDQNKGRVFWDPKERCFRLKAS